jgi:hypothetical protein
MGERTVNPCGFDGYYYIWLTIALRTGDRLVEGPIAADYALRRLLKPQKNGRFPVLFEVQEFQTLDHLSGLTSS